MVNAENLQNTAPKSNFIPDPQIAGRYIIEKTDFGDQILIIKLDTLNGDTWALTSLGENKETIWIPLRQVSVSPWTKKN